LKNTGIAGGNSSLISFGTVEARNEIICLFIDTGSMSDSIASSYKMTVNHNLEMMWKKALMA
jgi:hypothetical protein